MQRIVGLLWGVLAALPVQAWNDGHMAVAAIAYDRLTPETRTKVAALLKLNPDHARWVAAAGSHDPDKAAFMRSAYWPDDIKFKSEYRNDGATWQGAATVEGYADKKRHRYWHYKDIPFSTDGSPLPKATKATKAPNALTQITTMRAILARKPQTI